jgi:hypothetical protein
MTGASVVRLALGGLLALAALNAVGGACYGLAGAHGIPTSWLRGSPFSDDFVPSFVLLIVVGGALLVAAVSVLRGSPRSRLTATAAGVILLGWIAAQVAIIGYVSWMQPATAAAGLLILGLALLLPQPPPSSPARAFLASL